MALTKINKSQARVRPSILNAAKLDRNEKEKRVKHGMSYTPEHNAWRAMKSRCYDKNRIYYKDYGGRGIQVCDRWLHSFENFYEDMGDRPTKTSLDRIDNNGDYSPDNCRWATSSEQNRNRRNIKIHKGKTLTEWARHLGIKQSTLSQRYYVYGWSIDRCLDTPVSRRS